MIEINYSFLLSRYEIAKEREKCRGKKNRPWKRPKKTVGVTSHTPRIYFS
jgi:hypothetical protein